MKIKVLHIAETARGGVGTYVDLLTELERATYESRVILPDSHASMLSMDTHVRTFRYAGRTIGAFARLTWASLREFWQFEPDIVFCHSTFSQIPLVLLRLMSHRAKFIYCAHGWAGTRETSSRIKALLVRGIEGLMCRFAHRVINISQSEFEYAASAGYGGTHITIENAVRPARSDIAVAPTFKDDAKIHLLFVGRLDRQKGLDILLDAFALARQANPGLMLSVIGESVVSEGLLPSKEHSGVKFLGWVGFDQIDAFYRDADLVVVPSRWEGFGLVVAESYRNGTPVLTSDRGALPDLVVPGCTGITVGLSVKEFAGVLAGLEKKQLQAMRPFCLQMYANRFHIDRFSKDIFRLYGDLLTDYHRGA